MRTNIMLDEQLVKEAMRLSNARAKKEVVDLALQSFVAACKRKNIKNLFGNVKWEGDLKKMRKNINKVLVDTSVSVKPLYYIMTRILQK